MLGYPLQNGEEYHPETKYGYSKFQLLQNKERDYPNYEIFLLAEIPNIWFQLNYF